MVKHVFIDYKRMMQSIGIGLLLFILVAVLSIFFSIKYNLFQDFSFFTVVVMLGYIFIMVKWVQALVNGYYLAIQKEPFITIDDKGVTYCIKKSRTIFLPWNAISKIDHGISGIVLCLKPKTKVPFQFPFGRIGENTIATINYVDTDLTELYNLLLSYKQTFATEKLADISITKTVSTRDTVMLLIGIIFFAVYFSTYYQNVTLLTACLWCFVVMLMWQIACFVYDYLLDRF